MAHKDDVLMAAVETRLVYAKMLVKMIKAVAPVSLGAMGFKLVAYLLGHHAHLIRHRSSRLITALNVILLSESVFAAVCAVHRVYAQRFLPAEKRPSTNVKDRKFMFDRCLHTIAQPKDFATKWLRDHSLEEIKRGNVEDWLSWGMFDKKALELDDSERAEMDYYIAAFEERAKHKFQPGHNGMIRCYKFDHEPVESEHRPLMYYGVVHGLLQCVTLPLLLRAFGFGSRRSSGCFNYFLRKAIAYPAAQAGEKQPGPIVIIHGIGIGPLPYAHFAKAIAQASEASARPRDVIVLELPAIAQQLFPSDLLPQTFLENIESMLDAEGYERAIFVGHSYGTFALSWIVKHLPARVEQLAFLDPAPFLLHDSSVLRAIVYKQAQNDAEELFAYFLRNEMFFNSHTKRHFMWQENLLFFEQIPKSLPTLLVLSEKDEIMPVDAIMHNVRTTHDIDHVSVLYLEDTTHGGLLMNSKKGAQVVDRIVNL